VTVILDNNLDKKVVLLMLKCVVTEVLFIIIAFTTLKFYKIV